MNFIVAYIILANFFSTFEARVIIVPDQNLEDCSGDDNPKVFDFTNFQLVPVNDTHTFINGTWDFLKELRAPWVGRMTLEKYTRGEWLMQAFNREYSDVCAVWHSELEPYYFITKELSGCPMKPGTSWKFDMVPIVFDELLLNSIPRHYAGRWRAVFVGEFESDGKKAIDCKRAYADVYED